jgi:hypothetical protein
VHCRRPVGSLYRKRVVDDRLRRQVSCVRSGPAAPETGFREIGALTPVYIMLPPSRLLGSQRDFVCPITDLWPGITSGLPVIRPESGRQSRESASLPTSRLLGCFAALIATRNALHDRVVLLVSQNENLERPRRFGVDSTYPKCQVVLFGRHRRSNTAYRCGFKKRIPKGGSVRSKENGWPCAGTVSASTPPAFP